MNPTEQRERSTVVHQLESRLTDQMEAVCKEFDSEVEKLYKHRVADLMTISGLESLIVGVDAALRSEMSDAADDAHTRTNTLAGMVYSFHHATLWQRLKWLITGEVPPSCKATYTSSSVKVRVSSDSSRETTE